MSEVKLEHKVVKGVAWSFSEKLLSMVVQMAVSIIVASGQARLRALDRCILTGRLCSDGRLGELPDPRALAEYARANDMLAVMPQSQALGLPKELIDSTLMIDSLYELIEMLKEK